ncbi:MAG TPA: hypothetical protein VF103_13240 [Polyangiaceae bacterium]
MKRLIGLGWFVGTWCATLATACSGGSDEESARGGGGGAQATGGSATGGSATGGSTTGGSATGGSATGGSATGGGSGTAAGGSATGGGSGSGLGGASGAGGSSGAGSGSGGKGGSGGGAGEWTCEDLGGEICFCRLGGEPQTLPACEGAMWTCCALSAMNCQCFAGLSDADCEATIAVDSRLTRAASCPP